MADLEVKERSGTTRIVGDDETYAVDVVLENGRRKLAITDQTVRIESLAGVQEAATTYFFITSVSDGQTLTINLQAGQIAPVYSKTFTVGIGETKYEFATRIILELNQDFTNFQPYYRALDIEDNAAVYILSKTIGEAGDLPNDNDFTVTGTVPVVINTGYDKLLRRSATVQAALSSKDPRLSIFGIQGVVESKDASVEGLYVQKPFNGIPGAVDLNVDGSVTPQVFTFPMDALDDLFINEIKFFGRDNGIQFANFLGQNGALINGILIEIKTNNNMIVLPPIKTTDDFDDVFAFGGSNFDVYFASGADKFSARFLASAFPLRRSGTFGAGNDDYIKITIRDNLTNITYLQSVVSGFRQEA